MMAKEICVPAAALSAAGEGDEAAPVAPGVGDEVEMTIKGTVTRAEGDNVYVMPAEANGMPIEQAAGEPMGEGDTEEDMDALVARERENYV